MLFPSISFQSAVWLSIIRAAQGLYTEKHLNFDEAPFDSFSFIDQAIESSNP